ncbi:hypothetical protein [Haloquadratum walsbyi]|jgi:hypothetical protein|uniref:Uncharacterized protein n=1 Tax=Haloquadratum walsbyi J07HQW2 TaxID=1238425 RepID=U1NG31_9EURY|nr:hypothetical protein [Haloquadratum walsbyi]ERG95778.1 MAG: hypothetical protein J07HQW2_02238 [Haloquadratum walsbyi J07HQW2]
MMKDQRRPIEAGEQDILDHLEAYIDANTDDDTLTRETATVYLMKQGIGRVEVNNRLKQLLLKGYLYEVGEEIRIPPRP